MQVVSDDKIVINKKTLNSNIHLSEGNIKSKCTEKIIFLTWSLLSRVNCPYATKECLKRCFAKKNENFEGVRVSRDRNFEESKKETFTHDMINILNYQLQRPKMKDKRIFVRIHASGDFMNVNYMSKWVDIAEYFKGNNKILFQAYTKSMPILNEYLSSTSKSIADINIHFVWSVWHDTPIEYTKLAKKIGLQTFTALPKNEIERAVNNGSFLCEGDCGNCKECYTGNSKSIVIPYH